MFPYPYPEPDVDDELPVEGQAGDRPPVQINVYGKEEVTHPPRRKRKPQLTPSNVVLVSGGSALILSCLAWHLSGQHHRQQMAEQQQQHQSEIEQIERARETDKAKLRAVEGVICSPAQ